MSAPASLHRTDITNLLKGLVRKGLLVPKGVGRGTRYVLGMGISPTKEAISPTKEGISPTKPVISPTKGAISPDLGSSSPDLGPISPDLEGGISPDLPKQQGMADHEEGSNTESIPPHLDPRLLAIAEPVRTTGKSTASLVRSTILLLCGERYLSLLELSRLLNRRVESIRDSYVSPMTKEGLLERRFPEKRTHRDQAYRTVVNEREKEA